MKENPEESLKLACKRHRPTQRRTYVRLAKWQTILLIQNYAGYLVRIKCSTWNIFNKITYKQLKVTFNKIKITKNSVCYTHKNKNVPRRTSIKFSK